MFIVCMISVGKVSHSSFLLNSHCLGISAVKNEWGTSGWILVTCGGFANRRVDN